jgi:hypothetical protein
MNNSLLDTAVVPIQKLENAKPSNAMINTGQSEPKYFSYGGSVAPPEVQLAEPPPINLAFGGPPNVPVVPVAKTVEATTYSGDTVGEGIGNFAEMDLYNRGQFPQPGVYKQIEGAPEMFDKENPVFKYGEDNQTIMQQVSPEIRMILQAQINRNGINQMIDDSPIAKLKFKQYTEI